jgi:quercetin dioxygenase-like cupin family protein
MSAPSARERYVHHFDAMPQGNVLGGALSTGMGAAFTGERVYVGIVTKKKGTGSKPHYHLDETFNYVLKGALKVVMDGEEFIVPTGALLHIPPKVVHTAVASDDGDAMYLVCRDTTSDGGGEPTTVEV